MFPFRSLLPLVLLALLAAPLCGNETSNPPNLNEADSTDHINQYLEYEQIKATKNGKAYGSAEFYSAMVPVYSAAYKQSMAIAKTDGDKRFAYSVKYLALHYRELTGDANAENEMETFLKELSETKGFAALANEKYFARFSDKAFKSVTTPDDFNALKTELISWINRSISVFEVSRQGFIIARKCKYPLQQFGDELKAFIQSDACKLSAREKKEAISLVDNNVIEFMFYDFAEKSQKTVNTPESFGLFKTELKTWINKYDIRYIMNIGVSAAEKNNVSIREFANEMIAFIQSSDCTLPKSDKPQAVATTEGMLRLSQGSDPELYGKTIDGEEFHWKNLRGKYVLIKFTSTWCGPCKREIPGMLEAYQKYHDKGLEIVSVYIWESGNAVASVKKAIADEKLPWIILSEALTAGEQVKKDPVYKALSTFLKPAPAPMPKQGDFYGIFGVPTMVLTDKEGKIMMTQARGEKLQTKLAEIFE